MINQIINLTNKYKNYIYFAIFAFIVIIYYSIQSIQNIKKTQTIPLISPSITPTTTIRIPFDKSTSFSDQAENEIIFNQAWDKFNSDFPWYKNLPITTANFTIVYDFDKKAFRIHITKTRPTDTEITSLTNEALAELKKINVDMKKHSFYLRFD